jgi:hypothetical protein
MIPKKPHRKSDFREADLLKNGALRSVTKFSRLRPRAETRKVGPRKIALFGDASGSVDRDQSRGEAYRPAISRFALALCAQTVQQLPL